MSKKFYQIAGDQPGTSIYINPRHVVRLTPNGANTRIHLSDKTVYEVAGSVQTIGAHILECLD